MHVRLRIVSAAAVAAVLVPGCATNRRIVEQQPTSNAPATISRPSPIANKQKAQAEAGRLLRLVVVPPGSTNTTSGPSPLLSGPAMGTPATTSLIDDTAFWKVPIPMSASLAWFVKHPPGGLPQSGSASTSSRGITTSAGYGYDAPSTPAWNGASVEIDVAATGPKASVVRADGMTLWVDPVPVADNETGPRMHTTVASGCLASDKGYVGVTNTPPPLDRSLLPSGVPTSGLICEYYGANGRPFALKQKKLLDSTSGKALSASALRLPLGHLDGEVINCPNDDGSVTVIALAYPDRRNVDLWMATTGCATVANGTIRAPGTVSP
jgi:hypothetical protein